MNSQEDVQLKVLRQKLLDYKGIIEIKLSERATEGGMMNPEWDSQIMEAVKDYYKAAENYNDYVIKTYHSGNDNPNSTVA